MRHERLDDYRCTCGYWCKYNAELDEHLIIMARIEENR